METTFDYAASLMQELDFDAVKCATLDIVRARTHTVHDLAQEIDNKNKKAFARMNDGDQRIFRRSKFAFYITKVNSSLYITGGTLESPLEYPLVNGEPLHNVARAARTFCYESCFKMGFSKREIDKGYMVEMILY